MKKCNQYSAEFKAKVVLEVLRKEATVNEIADKYSIHPGMINRWKQEFFKNPEYIKLLDDNGVKISMDGKGQCLDNARRNDSSAPGNMTEST